METNQVKCVLICTLAEKYKEVINFAVTMQDADEKGIAELVATEQGITGTLTMYDEVNSEKVTMNVAPEIQDIAERCLEVQISSKETYDRLFFESFLRNLPTIVITDAQELAKFREHERCDYDYTTKCSFEENKTLVANVKALVEQIETPLIMETNIDEKKQEIKIKLETEKKMFELSEEDCEIDTMHELDKILRDFYRL